MKGPRARRGTRQQRTAPQSTGPMQSFLKPVEILSDDQVESIHGASLRVLNETGIEIMSPIAATITFWL